MRAPRGRAPPRERARAEGAGPRGVSAARDEKLVPDIYLTLPGSTDEDAQGRGPSLERDDRGRRLLFVS